MDIIFVFRSYSVICKILTTILINRHVDFRYRLINALFKWKASLET